MRTTTIKNKNGLELSVNDRISVDGKPGTIKGFHREMIQVQLDVFPDTTITVDSSWHIEKIEK